MMSDPTSSKTFLHRQLARIFPLSLFVIVAVLAGFNYYLWLDLANLKEHVTQVTPEKRVNQHLNTSTEQRSEDKATIDSLQVVTQRVTTLAQQQQQLQATVEVLMQKPRYRADWLLAEIMYLLNIANHRLVLVADLEGALMALQLAEAHLQKLNYPPLLQVRKQLTDDILKLRQIKRPDIGGLAIKLSSYIAQVDHLPLLQGQYQTLAEPDAQTQPTKDSENTIWQEVRQLVTIRYNPNVEAGLLTAEQRALVRQNLRLQLESARFSLLRYDQENLVATITHIRHWLNRYYDQQDQKIKQLQTFLTQLQTMELNPTLPDIAVTLHRLQHFLTHPPVSSEAQPTTTKIIENLPEVKE